MTRMKKRRVSLLEGVGGLAGWLLSPRRTLLPAPAASLDVAGKGLAHEQGSR